MNDLDLKYFELLPDGMNKKDVALEFDKLLQTNYNSFKGNKDDLMQAWYEVSDRQYHTWELIDNDLKELIEDWFELNWNTEPVFLDALVFIICGIGLERTAKKFRSINKLNLDSDTRAIVEESLTELQGTVGNPYAEYEK